MSVAFSGSVWLPVDVDSEQSVSSLPSFESVDLLDRLETLTPREIDRLPFGVIAFDAEEKVTLYNTHESSLSGIDPKRVLGSDLFVEVAPCTNNYLVAERYRMNQHLDEQLDYVFTLRMRPTPVRLRLLSQPDARYRYMVVARLDPI